MSLIHGLLGGIWILLFIIATKVDKMVDMLSEGKKMEGEGENGKSD